MRYSDGAALDRLKPQELLDAYIEEARVDDPEYVERISKMIRDLVRRASYKREISDFEDFEEECVLAIWMKIRTTKTDESESNIKNIGAFVRQSVHNRYCDAVRRKRPKWYNLKIELMEILTGKAGIEGFSVWDGSAPGQRMCGFAKWEGNTKNASGKVRDILDRPGRFKRQALDNRQPSELPTYELVGLILNYVKGPVEVDVMTNCVVELAQLKGVDTVSIDGMGDADSEGTSGHEWLISSETNVEKQVTDTGWFEHVAQWFWEEFEELSEVQRQAILLGMGGDQVTALVAAVGMDRVAAAVRMSPEELTDIIDDLPMPDVDIAKIVQSAAKSVPSIRFKAWAKIRRRSQASELMSEI